MDLFDSESVDESGVPAFNAGAPLAVRMRPTTLDEVVGQSHLLVEGAPLRRLQRVGQRFAPLCAFDLVEIMFDGLKVFSQ